MQNLVEPIERRYMEVRSGRARAPESPVPGEGRGEPHAGERQYRMLWPDC
jgi:hypothetical protein